jgi:hypothetical protein
MCSKNKKIPSAHTAIISLYSTIWLAVITEMENVYCGVGRELQAFFRKRNEPYMEIT